MLYLVLGIPVGYVILMGILTLIVYYKDKQSVIRYFKEVGIVKGVYLIVMIPLWVIFDTIRTGLRKLWFW